MYYIISYILKASKAVAMEEGQHRSDCKFMPSQQVDGLIQFISKAFLRVLQGFIYQTLTLFIFISGGYAYCPFSSLFLLLHSSISDQYFHADMWYVTHVNYPLLLT